MFAATPSLFSGYRFYISNLLQGDLGISYVSGVIAKRRHIYPLLPSTLELCFSAILLAILFGIPLGILGAVNSTQCRKLIFRAFIPRLIFTGILGCAYYPYMAAIYSWEISAIGQYNLLYEIKPSPEHLIDVWFIE